MGDNSHQHIVQCTLPINLYNEKFFICFWFWLVVLAGVNFFGLIRWLIYSLPCYRRNFFKKFLKNEIDELSDVDKICLERFVFEICNLDGFLLFGLLSSNTNFNTIREIIGQLLLRYRYKPICISSSLNRNENLRKSKSEDV
jgi:innexin